MQARINLTLIPVDEAIRVETRHETMGLQHRAERMWHAISKYITVDKDGIFADPDWPYLWSKK